MSNSYNEILGSAHGKAGKLEGNGQAKAYSLEGNVGQAKTGKLEARSRMVNVGHGNFVERRRILAVMASASLPMKRFREKAQEENFLVDATKGKKTKSLIVMDSKHVILSSLTPQTLHERLESGPKYPTLSQIELEEGEFVS